MIKDSVKKYIIAGSCITIAMVLIFSLCLTERCSIPTIITPLVFTVVSILNIKILTMPSLSALLKFSSAFMITNMVKFLVQLAFFLVSYLNLQNIQRSTFVVILLSLYVVYAVMDTVTLLKLYKNSK